MRLIGFYVAIGILFIMLLTMCGPRRDPAVDAWNECVSDDQLASGGTLPKSAQEKADCLEGVRERYPRQEP